MTADRSRSKKRGSDQNARPITRGGDVRPGVTDAPFGATHHGWDYPKLGNLELLCRHHHREAHKHDAQARPG
jgi:hypothetical protein